MVELVWTSSPLIHLNRRILTITTLPRMKQLIFITQAEFLSEGDVVDSINISADAGGVAVISGAITITASDEFDRIVHDGTTGRADGQEGLILTTASTVTAASSIVFDDAASMTVAGIDLSAGTTGDSVLITPLTHGCKANDASGLGRNTIKGGGGADVIIGEDKNDSLMGNAGGDRITTGSGKDTVAGGDDNDTIVMETYLTNQDSITGGSGSDSLTFTDSNSDTNDLDGVSGVETVILGDATSSIKLVPRTTASQS